MKRPPRFVLLLVRLLGGRQLMEEIEGDLHEDYLDNLESMGPAKARWIYIWTAIRSIRPYLIIHNKENRKPKPIDMLNYHLKMALRSMSKSKTFTAINILGLTVGMASSLAIILFIIDQRQMDDFQVNQHRIYRLESEFERDQELSRTASQHASLITVVHEQIPGIEAYARVSSTTRTLLRQTDSGQELLEEGFVFTDPGFLKVFSFEVIRGKQEGLLTDPGELAITESAAMRYFGRTEVVGEIVAFAGEYEKPKQVTAVLADPPANSTIQFDYLAMAAELLPPNQAEPFKSRFSLSLPVYLLLEEQADPEAVAAGIVPELSKHTDKPNLVESRYYLSNFDVVKYDMEVVGRLITPVDQRVINMFGIIATFIILLAVINYINLTSARSIQRAQEVGVRKISGANRKVLLGQFLTESFLLCFLSFFLALISLEGLIPVFEGILERNLHFDYLSSAQFMSLLVGSVMMLGLIAGLYPAWLLSRFKLSHFFKGQFSNSRQGALLRRVLVVFQFTFSIALILGALLVQRQLDFVRQQTLSFSPEQVVVLKGQFGLLSKSYEALKASMGQIPGVNQVSVANSAPGDDRYASMTKPDLPGRIVRYIVDEDYLNIFNLKLAAGENFGPGGERPTEIIINQTLANMLEVEDPLYSTAYKFYGRENNKIIGVVEDFHFESLHSEIKPVVICQAASLAPALTQVVVKLQTENFAQTIDQLEEVWNEFYPQAIFDYEFLDDRLDRLYTSEYRLSRVFGVFTLLAILISCLGLFGLSTHLAQVKLKEISIRKVLGASMAQIITFMGRRVYALVILAALLAVPIAYYFIDQWLNDFAYRMSISWTVFALTFGLCLLLATLTTGWHTLKVAGTNPAETLRRE